MRITYNANSNSVPKHDIWSLLHTREALESNKNELKYISGLMFTFPHFSLFYKGEGFCDILTWTTKPFHKISS